MEVSLVEHLLRMGLCCLEWKETVSCLLHTFLHFLLYHSPLPTPSPSTSILVDLRMKVGGRAKVFLVPQVKSIHTNHLDECRGTGNVTE